MSKLEELIDELCPDGVEYVTVNDITISLKTGLNPRQNFKLNEDGAEQPYITGKDIYNNQIYVTNKTDKISMDVVNLINKRAALETNDLLFLSTGTGTVGRMTIIDDYSGDWSVSESIYVLKPDMKKILPYYLMNILYTQYAKMQYEPKISKSSVPHLKVADLVKVKIPLPPLEVQREIVRVLDNLTELTAELKAELTAELTARKRQYEYYLGKLFEFNKNTQWKEMEAEFPFIRNGFVGTATPYYTNESEGVRYLQGTNIHHGVISDKQFVYITREFHEKHIRNELKEDDILMVQSGHVGECAVVGEKYKGANCHALIIMSNGGNCDSRYISYYLNSPNGLAKLKVIATGETIKHILASRMKKFLIPVPPLEEQHHIVEILDRFSAIYKDITTGIPAEIDARQIQYEYYRDKLLTFKELGAHNV